MTVPPMVAMSMAIRQTVAAYAPTLSRLPDDVLRDFRSIVRAFLLDLDAEHEYRVQAGRP